MTTTRTNKELIEENLQLRGYLEETQMALQGLQWDYNLLESNFEALAIHGIKNLVNSVTGGDNSEIQ